MARMHSSNSGDDWLSSSRGALVLGRPSALLPPSSQMPPVCSLPNGQPYAQPRPPIALFGRYHDIAIGQRNSPLLEWGRLCIYW